MGRIWQWLKWPVALGLIAVLYWNNQAAIEKLSTTEKNWSLLGLGVICVAVTSLITFVRWYLLVAAQGFDFRLQDALRLGFVGLLFNYVGPGSAGGDLFKAFFLAREQTNRRAVAIATVLLDRIMGVLALFVIGSCTTFLQTDWSSIPELRMTQYGLWIGALAGLAGIALMLSRWFTQSPLVRWLEKLPVIGKHFGELLHGMELYQSQKRVIGLALALSVVGQVVFITGAWCCARSLVPQAPSLLTHFFFMPIAEVFGALVPTPGGLGALEGAIQGFYVLLTKGTMTTAEANAAGFLAAIAFRLASIVIAAIGAFYYLTARGEIDSAIHAAETASVPAEPASTAPDAA